MDEQRASEIDLAAVLNSFTYLDTKVANNRSWTLSEVMDQLDKIYAEDSEKDPPSEFFQIKSAISAHPEWGRVELIDQSSTNATPEWTDDLIEACTFKDPDGNFYVCYRGTGDGRWCDNGEGMTVPSTLMQEAAARYFDDVAEKYMLDARENGKTVTVTGHSKGGNEAQYAYMASEHADLIDNCYSLDGQGFSAAAVEKFKKRYGNRYEEKLSHMYSICGKDDYVHQWGQVIIPDENTYYVETKKNGFYPWHHITYMTGDGNEVYTGLQWKKEENKIVNGSQGTVGAFVNALVEKMMKLDDEDLNGSAVAAMFLIDFFKNHCNVDILGDRKVKPSDFVDLLAHGVPTLIAALFTTEEGRALLKSLIDSVYQKYGAGGAVAVVAVVSLLLVVLAPMVTGIVILANVLDFVIDTVNKLAEFAGKIEACISDIKEAFVSFVEKHFSWLWNGSSAQKYLASHPQIQVDTQKMLSYAHRLSAVNTRIASLDRRMDSLYLKVGLLGLWDLMQADLLTSYSRRLKRCANYLSDTAEGFADVESALAQALQ